MVGRVTSQTCPPPMKATSNGAFQVDNPLDYAQPLAILQILFVLILTRGSNKNKLKINLLSLFGLGKMRHCCPSETFEAASCYSINRCDLNKKLPAATYKSCLSYHSTAVNVLRFSYLGEQLASGADGGDLVIWKFFPSDDGPSWKVLKVLSYHRKDVLDLEWSADGAFLVSGSVDNCCLVWDVNEGSVHQILDGHQHYVQGVAWDPLASISSDRTCRIYVDKHQTKTKGLDKRSYVCQYILVKSEQLKVDDCKMTSVKNHLSHDETLPFRRLAWSPDGSFLIAPAGSYKFSSASETINTAYIISRKDLSSPALKLPANVNNQPDDQANSFFKLPYRVIFAVATLNSLYIYDTESVPPRAVLAGLHHAAVTDIAWSSDAKYLAMSSLDGYCTLSEFEDDELGTPVSTADKKVSQADTSSVAPEQHGVSTMEIDKVQDVHKGVMIDTCEERSVVPSTVGPAPEKPERKRITPVAL
ncbi:hypothetical protein H6P81_007721 [Aristolochia fimbriata]|uniref:CAF1B/HIR1 beta-propeller domain-containing protein n=1 Tax=Aristolochia fimbriata TaxID=158543 RepID=A0AAV7F4V3_ARIFI|nr:hypothetical protein H6P81_007721 [Aristolochia fimbriata]